VKDMSAAGKKIFSSPSEISSIIGGIVGQESFESLRNLEKVKKAWKEAAGDFISRNTGVVAFDKGVLKVNARTGAFVFQLNSLKNQYLSNLNGILGSNCVRDVEFRAGRITSGGYAPDRPVDKERTSDENSGEEVFGGIGEIEVPEDVMTSIKIFIESVGFSDDEIRQRAFNATVDFYRIGQAKRNAGYIECAVCRVLFDDREKNGICANCKIRLKSVLSADRRRIVERPFESYEQHENAIPGISFGEFSYIQEEEFERAKKEAISSGSEYITGESREVFKKFLTAVRTGLSIKTGNVFLSSDKFTENEVKLIGDYFGPNVRAILVRGMLVTKI